MVASIDAMKQELKKRNFIDTTSGYSSNVAVDISMYSSGQQVSVLDTLLCDDIYKSDFYAGQRHAFNGEIFISIQSVEKVRKKEEKAIALLDAWMNEEPDKDLKDSLDKLKIEINSFRSDDRQLF